MDRILVRARPRTVAPGLAGATSRAPAAIARQNMIDVPREWQRHDPALRLAAARNGANGRRRGAEGMPCRGGRPRCEAARAAGPADIAPSGGFGRGSGP